MLRIQNLKVSYRKIVAVWDINVHVDKDAFVALIGANGAGKSTVLKAVLGLVQIEAGQIFFNNFDITRLPPWQKARLGIGFVPEGARIFQDLTVLENLLVGGISIPNKRVLKNRLEDAWRLFPVLYERQTQRAGTLSGGERQMLAIARALMSKPCLLLVDEISMGLMPILVNQVFSTLKLLNKEGVTIFIAEQNVRQTLSLASFAYVIENGRIVLSGPPESLLANDYIKTAYLGL